MAKDPAFLFYPSDFLTGTMFMNHEQVGIYVRLLCSQHQHGGVIDKISFNSLVGNNDIIRTKFIETEIGFFNERLANEMEKRNKKSNNISKAVKEVWDKRKESNAIPSKSNGIPKESKRKRKEIPMGIVNEDVNENKDLNKIPLCEDFINFAVVNKPKVDVAKVALKYSAWVANDWKDGNDKKITNWKTKLLNTLPHIDEVKKKYDPSNPNQMHY